MHRDQAGTRFRIESFHLSGCGARRVPTELGAFRVGLLACGFQNIEHEIGAVKKCPGRFFRLPLARNGVPVTNRANRALQYHVARRVTPKPPAAVLTPGTTVRVVTFVRCDQKLMRDITSITTAYVAAGLVLCQASWQISDHELCEGDARTCCQTHVCGIPSRHPATRCRSPSLWAGLR